MPVIKYSLRLIWGASCFSSYKRPYCLSHIFVLEFLSTQFVVFMPYISLATNFPCFPISLAAGKRGGETKGRGTSEGKRKSFVRKTTERGRE